MHNHHFYVSFCIFGILCSFKKTKQIANQNRWMHSKFSSSINKIYIWIYTGVSMANLQTLLTKSKKRKEKAVNHQKLTSFPEMPTIVLYQSVANIILKWHCMCLCWFLFMYTLTSHIDLTKYFFFRWYLLIQRIRLIYYHINQE